jgi:hypothetical protein
MCEDLEAKWVKIIHFYFLFTSDLMYIKLILLGFNIVCLCSQNEHGILRGTNSVRTFQFCGMCMCAASVRCTTFGSYIDRKQRPLYLCLYPEFFQTVVCFERAY